MKKLLFAVLLSVSLAACGGENSSTVSYQLDANGCLIDASGFDSESKVLALDSGIWTYTYVWECAEYVNAAEDIDEKEKKVTLVFEGSACLELTATMIGVGYCVQGLSPF